jgi:lysophospholipase L1-like esterase
MATLRESMLRSWTEGRRRLLLIAVSSIVSLGLAEGGLRIFSPVPGPILDDGADAPLTGLVFTSSLFARAILPARAHDIQLPSGIQYHINAYGYRGTDFKWKKPERTTRILVYGGSSVFDIHASGDEHWPKRLQRVLVERGHADVEVINAGIPGHASFDCVGRLLSEGHLLSPDFVLLYGAWNDIKYFQSKRSLLRTMKPYRPREDWLRRPNGPVDAALARVSHLYRLTRLTWLSRGRRLGPEGLVAQHGSYTKFSGSVQAAQLRQFEVNVATFVDVARNAGAVPILVTEARLVASDNSNSDRGKIAYGYVRLSHEQLLAAFVAADEVLKEVARVKGVTLVDASARLPGRSDLFVDQVHLSPEGGGQLASLLADVLSPML